MHLSLQKDIQRNDGDGEVEQDLQPVFLGMIDQLKPDITAAGDDENQAELDDDFGNDKHFVTPFTLRNVLYVYGVV